MSELIQQREDQTREFNQSWVEHEKKLDESARADLQALEEMHVKQLGEGREQLDSTLPYNDYRQHFHCLILPHQTNHCPTASTAKIPRIHRLVTLTPKQVQQLNLRTGLDP